MSASCVTAQWMQLHRMHNHVSVLSILFVLQNLPKRLKSTPGWVNFFCVFSVLALHLVLFFFFFFLLMCSPVTCFAILLLSHAVWLPMAACLSPHIGVGIILLQHLYHNAIFHRPNIKLVDFISLFFVLFFFLSIQMCTSISSQIIGLFV